jgi:hypothetical protein
MSRAFLDEHIGGSDDEWLAAEADAKQVLAQGEALRHALGSDDIVPPPDLPSPRA